MQNTRYLDRLGTALIDVIGFLNSPQRDDALLREAGVKLDRALFPLLVALGARGARGARGALGIAELAGKVGRDHTTVSRQISKLERLSLVVRCGSGADRRRRAAQLTEDGRTIVRAITLARRRLLAGVLADWNQADRIALAGLSRRFADALYEFAGKRT